MKSQQWILKIELSLLNISCQSSQNLSQEIVIIFILIKYFIAQSVGIARKVLDSQILNHLQNTLRFNNDEKGHLVDEFESKYITLLGTICADSPA